MRPSLLRVIPARARSIAAVASALAMFAATSPACLAADGGRFNETAAPVGFKQIAYHLPRSAVGIASWYGGRHVGRRTANGEIHSADLRTAAHRSLPFGTIVQVTNLRNGKVSMVRVNDRGPFVDGRVIDLSEEAARDLAMLDDGLARVSLQVLGEE